MGTEKQPQQLSLWNILFFVFISSYFLFFSFFYKYHLFYAEQMQLFLLTKENFFHYFTKPAALSCYLGDFFTQFYYLKTGGAIVITASIALLWWLLIKISYRFSSRKWILVLPFVIVLFTALLHCDLHYYLASTMAFILSVSTALGYTYIKGKTFRLLTGILAVPLLYFLVGGYSLLFVVLAIAYELKIRNTARAKLIPYFALLGGLTVLMPLSLRGSYYLTVKQAFLYPSVQKITPFPNFEFEKLLGLDCEWYFNRPDKVIELARKSSDKNRYISYYYNLAYSSYNQLPDALMDFYQPGTAGLFIPLNKDQTYITVAFSNEFYFLTGDVNAAQHCALLGSTFSPKSQSVRLMRRLVEVNIINGEFAAAEKYIKMLEHTWFHRQWAKEMSQFLYNDSLCNQNTWIGMKRNQIPVTDFIKDNPNDFEATLRHLVGDHPDNQIAFNYLCCYFLLKKDLDSFYSLIMEEVKNNRMSVLPALYQQALLVYFTQHIDDKAKDRIHFSPDIFNSFLNYTNLYAENSGNGRALQRQYGKTYWFYYHYAQSKEEMQ